MGKAIKFDVHEGINRVIFGIPLFDADGNPFPEDLMQSYLDSAIDWAEMILNICIRPRTLDERHDYLLNDYQSWGFLKLWKKPILEVETLEMYYGNKMMFQVPNDWIHVSSKAGQLQLFPSSGSSGAMIITASGGLVTPLLQGNIGYAPQMWRVRYRAGLEEPNTEIEYSDVEVDLTSTIISCTKVTEYNMIEGENESHIGKYRVEKYDGIYTQTMIHPLLKDMIYRRAMMGILGVWGDLIIGAGVANQSLSIDGLSQSIGTTQSAMFGGASARINQLKEDIEGMLPILQSFYNGLGGMTVV